MKSIVAFAAMIMFGIPSAFALDYQPVKISPLGDEWSTVNPKYPLADTIVIPQSEDAADILQGLDITKSYTCQMRAYLHGSQMQVYAVRNCIIN